MKQAARRWSLTIGLVLLAAGCTNPAPSAPVKAPLRSVLEFALVADSARAAPAGSLTFEYKGRDLTLEPLRRFAIQEAHVSSDNLGWPAVAFEIAKGEQAAFEQWTAESIHRSVTMLIDGKIILVATIAGPLAGQGLISNGSTPWSEEEARDVAARIVSSR